MHNDGSVGGYGTAIDNLDEEKEFGTGL